MYAYTYAWGDENRMRKKVSVTIDQKIYEKAHKLGLNVSKIAENALLSHIDAIETATSKNSFLSKASFTKEGLVRSPRFEPGSSAWQADVLDQTRLRPLFHVFLLDYYHPWGLCAPMMVSRRFDRLRWYLCAFWLYLVMSYCCR